MRSLSTLLLAIAIAIAIAGGASGADLEGRLLNGSTPGGYVVGHDVRLTAQLSDSERIDRTVATDDKGVYSFRDVPGDTADVYVLSTHFEHVDYVSSFIRFPLGADLVESDLLVYEATTSDSLLRLNARHLVIEIASGADHVLVTEVLAFGNPGQKTIVPERSIPLVVPHSASNIEAVEGFEEVRVANGRVELEMTGSVRPGTFRYEGAIRYHLPALFPLGINVQETLPADEVTILVAPTGTDVRGDGLEPLGTIDLGGGVVCDRFRVPVEAGAGNFTFFIDPTVRAVSQSPRMLAIVGGLLAAFVGLMLLRERDQGSDGPPVRELERLERDRTRYLSEIVALESGDRSDRDAHLRREKLLLKATAIQELIDELTEQRT